MEHTLTREGFLDLVHGRVWYGIHDAGASGVPLLVLHGGPGAPHDYLEPLAALADDRPVIFYDQLGCGSSDRPNDPALWTVGHFVEELAQVRAALGLAKVHLLGSSWGSTLAADYLLTRKPKGVVSLIFSGPCLSAQRFVADQRAHLARMPEPVRTAIETCEANGRYDSPDYQEAMMAFYARHVCRLDPWPDCMNRTIEKMGHEVYGHMWGPSEFTMTGTLKDYDCTSRLHEIAQPVLLTCGRYDEATPETTAYYKSLLPHAEMAVIEDASHEHHLEQPEEYLRLVREFLRRMETRS
jgi:proline iminopeptidase